MHSSSDGRFQLKLRPGGDLWLTTSWAPDQPYWSSGTGGSNADAAVMQGDGNFVLYRNGVAVWSTGTNGHPGAILTLQDDGNLVVYAPGNVAKWNSQTSWAGRTATPASDRLVLNEILPRGHSRYSPNRQVRLVLQEDGNLVLYAAGVADALWHTHTFGLPVTGAIIHPDGNLALYNTSNQPVWDLFSRAGIPSRPGAYLRVQDDGNLVLWDSYGGGAVWSSGTNVLAGFTGTFVPADTSGIAVPPGSITLPPATIILTGATTNTGVFDGAGRSVVLTGGHSIQQTGMVNAHSLSIGQYRSPDQGLGLSGSPPVPTIMNLGGNATVTAPGGVTVDGILGLSTGNVVTADTPVTVTTTGRLRGAGTVAGTLSVSGVVTPAGNATATVPHGQLKIGLLSLGTGSLLELQVAGPVAGTEHDQVVVTGGVSIDGALLSLDASYAPRGGAAIVLIDNRGTGPIGGTFRDLSGNPLPEGATVVANLGGTGRAGRISYEGGDGNDVCLTLANAAPTAVALATGGVAENLPAGTVVGMLSTTDPDAVETFRYVIVPDANLDGTDLFEIVGNQLRTKGPLDFEAKSTRSVRVRSTDEHGLFTGKVFAVVVTDGNDAPTDVTLSAASVVRNRPAGTVVGTFATIDQDVGDTFTYSLVPDPTVDGTALFEIVGNQLRTKSAFPTTAQANYSIRVRGTDSGMLHTGRVFTIAVTPPGPPVAATNVVGTPAAGEVTLSWAAPISDGGAVVRDYVVQYRGNGDTTWRTFVDAVSARTTVRVTGLVNGTGYLFRVLAKNALGTSLPSAASAAVTPRTVPGAPVRLVAAAQAGAASLTWSPPATTGGAPITDYLVEYSSNAGTTWRTFSDTPSATRSALVTGLTNGVAYVFRVRAVNAAGRGAFSVKSATIRPRA